MGKPPFQFGLKAIFVAMTAVAALFGAGIYWPTQTVVVVVCVAMGAASLLLNDLSLKWAKTKYRAELRYRRSRRDAIWSAYVFMAGSLLFIYLGIASILSGDKRGWAAMFAALMMALASVVCFRTARTPRQHWLEIALFNERRSEGPEDTLPPESRP